MLRAPRRQRTVVHRGELGVGPADVERANRMRRRPMSRATAAPRPSRRDRAGQQRRERLGEPRAVAECPRESASRRCAAPSPMKSVGRPASRSQQLGRRLDRRRLDLAPILVRARRTPRRARHRPTWRHRGAGPARPATNASASNADTPISGFSVANASPCIVAMPMRRPVNDPGPVATANTSIVRSVDASRSSSVMRSPRQPLGLVARPDRPRLSRSTRSSRAAHSCPRASWCRARGSAWLDR